MALIVRLGQNDRKREAIVLADTTQSSRSAVLETSRQRRTRRSRRVTIATLAVAALALPASAEAIHPSNAAQTRASGETPLRPSSPAPVITQLPLAPKIIAAVTQESTTADPKAAGVPTLSTRLTGDNAIPVTVLAAYRKAAATLAVEQPGCHLSWPLLAAIGKVETDHGRTWGAKARITAAGEVVPTILGPVLDGENNAKLLDTDGGALDHNTVYDRAVGPMQFVPSTWREVGRDGNGDGKADPNNIWDASLGAASYLCANHRDLANSADRRAAILSYNPSSAYVRSVLAWAALYQRLATSGPALASVPDPVVLGAGGVAGQDPYGDGGSTDAGGYVDGGSYEGAGNPADSGGLLSDIFGPQPADTTPSLQPSVAPSDGTKKPAAKPAAKPAKPAAKPTVKPTAKPTPAAPVCVMPGVTLGSKARVSAVPVDADRNGKFDALRVTMVVTAAKAGPFTFTVQLLDTDHYTITGALHTVHLKAGQQTVIDDLSGAAIGDAGARGPATLHVTVRQAAASISCAKVLPYQAYSVQIDPSRYDGWTVELARLQQRLGADISAGLVKDEAATALPAALQSPSADAPNLGAFLAALGDTPTVDPAETLRLGSLAQRLIDQAAASQTPPPSPSVAASPSPTPELSPSPSPTPSPSLTPSPLLTPSPSITPTPDATSW